MVSQRWHHTPVEWWLGQSSDPTVGPSTTNFIGEGKVPKISSSANCRINAEKIKVKQKKQNVYYIFYLHWFCWEILLRWDFWILKWIINHDYTEGSHEWFFFCLSEFYFGNLKPKVESSPCYFCNMFFLQISLQMQQLLEASFHSDSWSPVKIKFNWDASYWTKQMSSLGKLKVVEVGWPLHV